MNKNILHFGLDSEQVEVVQFPASYEEAEIIYKALGKEPEERLALDVVSLMRPIDFSDFKDVPAGVFEYLAVYDARSKEKGNVLLMRADGFSRLVKGSVLFLKRKRSGEVETELAAALLEPFSPREVNLFANWFGMSIFMGQMKGDSSGVILLSTADLEAALHDLVSLDSTHDQKTVMI